MSYCRAFLALLVGVCGPATTSKSSFLVTGFATLSPRLQLVLLLHARDYLAIMAALALARKAHAFSCQASHYTLECRKRRDLSVCHLCDGFTKYLVQVGWLLTEQSCDNFQVSALRLDDSSVCHCSERDSIQVVVVSEPSLIVIQAPAFCSW
jgi:hypothetical protein